MSAAHPAIAANTVPITDKGLTPKGIPQGRLYAARIADPEAPFEEYMKLISELP
jgi:hypothetical protein